MAPTNTLPNVAHYMKEITLYLRNCRLDCELVLVVIGRCLGAAAFPVWKAVHLLPPTTLPFCFSPFCLSPSIHPLLICQKYAIAL